MDYDINWLLSSVAQASAAMIAIVGGLLVTRYVGLHAEQQATGRRLTDLRTRATKARAQIDEDLVESRTVEAANIVDDVRVFDALFEAALKLPVEHVFNITGADPIDYDKDLVQGQLDAVAVQLREAFTAMDPLVPESTIHDSWADFRNAHPELAVGHRNAWEWAYGKVCKFKKYKARNDLKAVQRTVYNAQQIYRTVDVTPPRIRFDTQRVRDMLTARIRDAEKVAEEAELEAVFAEKAYEATRQPEGFGLALRVLRMLALCGVAPPVLLMAFGGNWGYPFVSAAVAILFFVGLGTLLRFLFVYASFLHHGGRAELPTGVLGLFSPAADATPAATSPGD